MVCVWKNTLRNHCREAELLGQGKAETKATIDESQVLCVKMRSCQGNTTPHPPK